MENPWMGLASYSDPKQNKQTCLFCGRANATAKLNSIIISNVVVTLYGRSGIGKTSLLNAGVFPSLRLRSYFPVSLRLSKLNEASGGLAGAVITYLEDELREADITVETEGENHSIEYLNEEGNINYNCLVEYFYTRRFKDSNGNEVFPVLAFDQFEELFRMPRADDFLQQVNALAIERCDTPKGYNNYINYRLVLSIREDELYLLEDSITKLNLYELKGTRLRLEQLTDDEAKEIIETPGAHVLPSDVKERENVISKITSAAKDEYKGNLNTLMLSLICSELFKKAAAANAEKPQITATMIDQLGQNILHDFYLGIVKDIPEQERIFLEDNLVDANRMRNSVNVGLMNSGCPTWIHLTEGTNRILQVTNNKVELVHDQLTYAVFEVRENRKEAERIAALEKEQEEIQRLFEKETIEKNAIEKSKGDMILNFSLLLHYVMAMAGFWSWYHLHTINNNNFWLPWLLSLASQILICVPVSSIIIRKKADAIFATSLFVIGMLGSVAALFADNLVLKVLISYNCASCAMGLYSILAFVYLLKKGNLKKLFSQSSPSPVLSILSELRVRLFFVLIVVSGILLIDTYHLIKKSGGHLISCPTLFCCIAVLLLFLHNSRKKAYWFWTILLGVLIAALGILPLLSLFSEIAYRLNTNIEVALLVLSVVILFYIGFKYYNKIGRTVYIIVNVAVLLVFYFIDLRYNPFYFIGKEVVVPVCAHFYGYVLVKENINGNNSTEKVYYIYNAWDGRRVYDCPFDSISHQGWMTNLYIKTDDKCYMGGVFKNTNTITSVPIMTLTAIENIRKHCDVKKSPVDFYMSSGLIESIQAMLNRARFGKKLEISAIPNVVKAKDAIVKTINQISNEYTSCKNDSLVYSLYESEAKYLCISGIIDVFERNSDNLELNTFLESCLISLLFEYHDVNPNVHAGLDSFEYKDYELMQRRTQFEMTKKYWITIFKNIVLNYIYKALKVQTSMDNDSFEKTQNSMRGTIAKLLDEQWKVVSKMAKSSDYDSGKFRYLLSSFVLAHRILNLDSIDWIKKTEDVAEISFDGKGLHTLDMLWATKIENEMIDSVPIIVKELLITSYQLSRIQSILKLKTSHDIDSLSNDSTIKSRAIRPRLLLR